MQYVDHQSGDELLLEDLRERLEEAEFTVTDVTQDETFRVRHSLSPRQVATIVAGGRIAEHKARVPGPAS